MMSLVSDRAVRQSVARSSRPFVFLFKSHLSLRPHVIYRSHRATPPSYTDLRINMHFLTPLILALSLASASSATFSLFTRQTQICFVVPIAATDINGYTPCGDGSVLTGCTCCPDLVTPCSATQQTCQLDSAGRYLCVDDPALAFTNCATQDLCPSTEQCCTLSDGSVGCCPLDGNGGGSAATTTAYSSSPGDSSSPTSTTAEAAQPTTLRRLALGLQLRHQPLTTPRLF